MEAPHVQGIVDRHRSSWPAHRFDRVPPLEGAVDVAMTVRAAVLDETPLAPLRDLDRLCAVGGFSVGLVTLGGARAGLEGTLTPRTHHRFSIRVDEEPPGGWAQVPPQLRIALARHRRRFRICHEIGHSFFYDRRAPSPRRLLPHTRDEEAFCDRFASSLLLPDAVVAQYPATPEAIIECQQRYDVSLEVAARAFAQVHADAFVALLVARGCLPLKVRPQWHPDGHAHAPPPRWWTAAWLQEALDRPCGWPRRRRLRWARRTLDARWRPLADRRQVLLVALPMTR
jgi:hypothetical protein